MSAASALIQALAAGEPAILVTVARAEGSTPREAGASMLVTLGTTAGTIGGGALELEAVLEARRMIADGVRACALDIPLGPAIGQCCGGHVTLSLAEADAATLSHLAAEEERRRKTAPSVLVFGAGHTGQALARTPQPLPFRLTVIDTRPDRLAELPPDIARVATPLPEALVDGAEPGSAFVILTHDHALDFLIASRALAREDAAYVGMIGSATKREKFRRHLRDTGGRALDASLTLPIGGGAVRDKRPAVIAVLTAAEIVTRFAALENTCTGFAREQMRCNNFSADDAGYPIREAERHAATS